MRIIPPKTITDAVLTSSNVAEADEAAYNPATTYSAGQKVIVTTPNVHRIYKCLTNGTVGKYPPDNVNITSPPWEDLGATSRWRMFDTYVNTQTTNADSISVTLDASRCDSVVLFGVDAATVDLALVVGGVTVYSETVSMSLDQSVSWTDYFFNPFAEASDLSRTIPLYGTGAALTVTLTRTGGTAKLGHLVIGRSITLGGTKYSPKAGINDYSTKSVNDVTGDTYLKQGVYSRTLQAEMRVDNDVADYVFSKLTSYRATPLVWDFNNDGGTFNSLIVFGFYKEFAQVIAGPQVSAYSLEIEGMI